MKQPTEPKPQRNFSKELIFILIFVVILLAGYFLDKQFVEPHLESRDQNSFDAGYGNATNNLIYTIWNQELIPYYTQNETGGLVMKVRTFVEVCGVLDNKE